MTSPHIRSRPCRPAPVSIPPSRPQPPPPWRAGLCPKAPPTARACNWRRSRSAGRRSRVPDRRFRIGQVRRAAAGRAADHHRGAAPGAGRTERAQPAAGLSNVSGITFNAGEGGGGSGDSINIRGFSANANMQVDGLRATADQHQRPSSTSTRWKSSRAQLGLRRLGHHRRQHQHDQQAAQVHGFHRNRRAPGHRPLQAVDFNQPDAGQRGFAAFRLNLMAHGNDVPGRDQIRNKTSLDTKALYAMDTITRWAGCSMSASGLRCMTGSTPHRPAAPSAARAWTSTAPTASSAHASA